jgi:Na+-transporting NADH:ubiquinone oxidoreductase subunit C
VAAAKAATSGVLDARRRCGVSAVAPAEREGPLRTLAVAAAVCLTCSVLVSASAVLLRPLQEAGRERAREREFMAIVARQPALADMLAELEQVEVRARVVELATGRYADWVDPAELDPRAAERDPLQSVELPPERDTAGIGRRAKLATVYEVRREEQLELAILPVHGAGYGGVLRGYLAVGSDGNTVAGLGFYEHGETPGLGGEIDDPDWLAEWEGRQLRDAQGRVRIGTTMEALDPAAPEAAHLVDGITGATRTSDGVTNLLRFWAGADGFGPYLERIDE